jgi:hypothetical protein
VIGDFTRWNNGLVFGCDDSAQKEFLNKRYIGTQAPKDISFPNFKDLAKAFKIKHIKLKKIQKWKILLKNHQKLKVL